MGGDAWSGVLDGDPVTESFTWVRGLGINIDLRLDAFALVMVALVSGIGLLICIYSLGYFGRTTAVTATRTEFPGSLASRACSRCSPARCSASSCRDQLIALFIFWELTSVTSYLLIGNDDTNPRARAAALQAIFITAAADSRCSPA